MKFITYPFLFALLTLSNFSLAQKKKKERKAPVQKVAPIRMEKIANDGLTVLYGNAMMEKLQEEGSFESYMQLASDAKKIQYRSCAYAGDQVNFRIRASRFGLHLKYLLNNWQANRVIMAFGANEAYAGIEGLSDFKNELDLYLQIIKKRHSDAQWILVSPTAAEKDSSILNFDLSKRNSDLKLYTEAMNEAATKHGVKFIDLYTPTQTLFAATDGEYTVNGQNLSDKGSAEVGQLLAAAISDKEKVDSIANDSVAFKAVRKLVRRKALEVAQAYHPANGISYYGLRARAYEYNYEIPHHLKLANILDQAIWEQISSNTTITFPNLPIYKLENIPNSPPKNGLGTVKSAKDDLADFTLAEGFSINCFASSEDHPELINPLQMQFDTRGRLWVACFASYPHPVPGTVSNDSILIFEDTNGDGKADKKTVFADGLDLPDGLAFHKKGVIVATARKLFYLEDTDGDSKADIKKEILRGFDNTDTHHSGYLQNSPHGEIILSEALFHRGQFETLHGVLHTKDTSIMSFDMDTRKLTVERQTEAPNPWKVTFNKWGEQIQFYGGGQIIDAETHNIAAPMGSAAPSSLGMPFRYDKGCSAVFVDSPNFPKEWQGALLTSHLLSTNELNVTKLKLVDGAYRADGKKTTIVKSSNKIFRPTDVVFGADGALYVSDFYYPIIGHAQHSIRHKERDYANGRIWRVTYDNGKVLKTHNLETKSTTELVKALEYPYLSFRQAVRNELAKRSTSEVNQLIQTAAKAHKTDDVTALELLWTMERQKDFSNTSLIKRLAASSNTQVRRAATRSLRWWADALGSDLEPILNKLATDSDDRVKLGVITVISHLQIEAPKWSTIGNKVVADKSGSPVAVMKSMLKWADRPGLAAEYPILEISRNAYITDTTWMKTNKNMKGTLYFKSTIQQSLILGHEANPYMNITVNNTPLLIASGGQHSKESQNTFLVKQGINKVDFHIGQGRRSNDKFSMYLSDSGGNKPTITFADKNTFAALAKEYEAEQKSNWKEFAVNTFKKNCANCHQVDTRAVGPPLKGLLGKQQTVISKDGSKRTVTVDEAYIRKSIKDPMAEYPEGYPPAMVPQPLNDTEIDNLVRWIMQLN